MTTRRRNRVDLHCHTSRSDGVVEPLDLHAQLRAAGTTLVAITDHDTVAGVREIHAAGLGLPGDTDGPRILAGVEINTTADDALPGAERLPRRGRELHVIGLGVDIEHPGLASALDVQRRGRHERSRRTVERLLELGIDVRAHLPADAGIESTGRPHIARALVASGAARSVEDAFRRYIDVGGPAYVPRAGMRPREAIGVIVDAGGLPILAHRPDAPDHVELIAALIEAGLAGIEVHYHAFDDAQVERMAAFAEAMGLLPSGGSDYHGDEMSYATAQAATHVPDEVGQRILERLER